MAIIVKSAIKISKGFDTWSAMVKSQDERLASMGIKFLFAGTEKNDPTQLQSIMMFPMLHLATIETRIEQITQLLII